MMFHFYMYSRPYVRSTVCLGYRTRPIGKSTKKRKTKSKNNRVGESILPPVMSWAGLSCEINPGIFHPGVLTFTRFKAAGNCLYQRRLRHRALRLGRIHGR